MLSHFWLPPLSVHLQLVSVLCHCFPEWIQETAKGFRRQDSGECVELERGCGKYAFHSRPEMTYDWGVCKFRLAGFY